MIENKRVYETLQLYQFRYFMSSPAPTKSDHLKHQHYKKNNLYTIFFTNILHGFGFSMFNVVYQPYLYQITQSEVILGYLTTFGTKTINPYWTVFYCCWTHIYDYF